MGQGTGRQSGNNSQSFKGHPGTEFRIFTQGIKKDILVTWWQMSTCSWKGKWPGYGEEQWVVLCRPQGSLPLCSERSFLCVLEKRWVSSHTLTTSSITVVPVERCLDHEYFTLDNGFTDEFIATRTTRWDMLEEVVTGSVSLKGLSCAQGLPFASLMYPRPHILPTDPLPHFRLKALELADLGPKPLKLLASAKFFCYIIFHRHLF